MKGNGLMYCDVNNRNHLGMRQYLGDYRGVYLGVGLKSHTYTLILSYNRPIIVVESANYSGRIGQL